MTRGVVTFDIYVSTMSFNATIDVLRERVPASLMHPSIGIVCGSGLSTLASSLRDKVLVSYDDLPGFAKSTGTFWRKSVLSRSMLFSARPHERACVWAPRAA